MLLFYADGRRDMNPIAPIPLKAERSNGAAGRGLAGIAPEIGGSREEMPLFSLIFLNTIYGDIFGIEMQLRMEEDTYETAANTGGCIFAKIRHAL
jgi:hypothetical protein